MNNAAQMTLGLVTPFEKVRPYEAGDRLVRTKDHERVIVERVERDPGAACPELLFCVTLTDGRNVILKPSEIAWRSC